MGKRSNPTSWALRLLVRRLDPVGIDVVIDRLLVATQQGAPPRLAILQVFFGQALPGRKTIEASHQPPHAGERLGTLDVLDITVENCRYHNHLTPATFMPFRLHLRPAARWT